MSFIKQDIDDLKVVVKEKSEELNISDEALESKLQVISEELRRMGVPEGDIEEKTYLRFLGSLKRRLVGNVMTLNGVIFGRTQDKDFGLIARTKAKEYVEKYGEEKAKEKGYMNDKGEYQYVDNPWNKGTIPENTAYSSYLGFFDDGKESNFYEVFINKDKLDEKIPFFQKITILAKSGNKKSKFFNTKKIYLNSYEGLTGDPIDSNSFGNFLIETFSDKVVSSFETLQKRGETGDRDAWYITEGEVIRSGNITESGDVPHEIASTNIAEDIKATLWIRESVLTGLSDIDNKNVLLIIRPFSKKDGSFSGEVYGILPESFEDITHEAE